MRVSSMLQRKGSDVVTIAPDATVAETARLLSEHNIGALVVSHDGKAVDGIVSERDLVREIAAAGAEVLDWPVSEVMTTVVATCGTDTTADELMTMMTNRRIRHVPVVTDGALTAIVSIGDVVKSRVLELEVQTETLTEYVTGSHM